TCRRAVGNEFTSELVGAGAEQQNPVRADDKDPRTVRDDVEGTRLGTGTVLDQARRPNRGQIPHRGPTFDLPTGDHTAVEGEPELFQGRRTRKTSPQLPIIGVPQVQVTFARITLWGDGQLRTVRAEGH